MAADASGTRYASPVAAALGPPALIGLVFAGSTIVTPLYVIYRQAFGFSLLVLTLIFAVYVVGNLAALMLFGRLSDQLGRRPVGLAAIGLACVSAGVFLCAQGTAWLFWARMLSGFAVGIGSGTGAAWIADFEPADNKSRATVIATCANFAGLGLAPMLGGVLAQYASWPLRLSFVVYLGLLLLGGMLLLATPETVQTSKRGPHQLDLRPRIGVPRPLRTRFIAPAATAFGCFALFGFYFALAPSLLAESLGRGSHAVAGAVVLELSAAATACIVLMRRLDSRKAMLCGLVLLLPSLALLLCARELHSMTILLCGTALSGIGGALGYRGSLQTVNHIAPQERRAEVVSTYLVACFLGNSVPVIGIGMLSTLAGAAAATVIFAAIVALFAFGGLYAGMRYRD